MNSNSNNESSFSKAAGQQGDSGSAILSDTTSLLQEDKVSMSGSQNALTVDNNTSVQSADAVVRFTHVTSKPIDSSFEILVRDSNSFWHKIQLTAEILVPENATEEEQISYFKQKYEEALKSEGHFEKNQELILYCHSIAQLSRQLGNSDQAESYYRTAFEHCQKLSISKTVPLSFFEPPKEPHPKKELDLFLYYLTVNALTSVIFNSRSRARHKEAESFYPTIEKILADLQLFPAILAIMLNNLICIRCQTASAEVVGNLYDQLIDCLNKNRSLNKVELSERRKLNALREEPQRDAQGPCLLSACLNNVHAIINHSGAINLSANVMSYQLTAKLYLYLAAQKSSVYLIALYQYCAACYWVELCNTEQVINLCQNSLTLINALEESAGSKVAELESDIKQLQKNPQKQFANIEVRAARYQALVTQKIQDPQEQWFSALCAGLINTYDEKSLNAILQALTIWGRKLPEYFEKAIHSSSNPLEKAHFYYLRRCFYLEILDISLLNQGEDWPTNNHSENWVVSLAASKLSRGRYPCVREDAHHAQKLLHSIITQSNPQKNVGDATTKTAILLQVAIEVFELRMARTTELEQSADLISIRSCRQTYIFLKKQGNLAKDAQLGKAYYSLMAQILFQLIVCLGEREHSYLTDLYEVSQQQDRSNQVIVKKCHERLEEYLADVSVQELYKFLKTGNYFNKNFYLTLSVQKREEMFNFMRSLPQAERDFEEALEPKSSLGCFFSIIPKAKEKPEKSEQKARSRLEEKPNGEVLEDTDGVKSFLLEELEEDPASLKERLEREFAMESRERDSRQEKQNPEQDLDLAVQWRSKLTYHFLMVAENTQGLSFKHDQQEGILAYIETLVFPEQEKGFLALLNKNHLLGQYFLVPGLNDWDKKVFPYLYRFLTKSHDGAQDSFCAQIKNNNNFLDIKQQLRNYILRLPGEERIDAVQASQINGSRLYAFFHASSSSIKGVFGGDAEVIKSLEEAAQTITITQKTKPKPP